MKTIITIFFLTLICLASDNSAGRLTDMLEERAANARAAHMTTDQRIDFYRSLTVAHPGRSRYEVLLAASFLQKMRETTNFDYVNRASKILDNVLAAEPTNYDALTLRAQVQLEYHKFADAAATARRLISIRPSDPLNWGALADSLTEMGDYDAAGDAIQRMVDLRPDMASYNRAAHFRFLMNDVAGAIEIMERAISAGSSSPENVSWCLVELGDMQFKTGRIAEARATYESAIRAFPGSHKAWAALGRLLSATGETDAAIASYRRAQSITPLPDYAAALYDLYAASGKKEAAREQRDTVDLIDRLAIANGEKVNRNLSLIFSDHDWNRARALELARAELNDRRDVYTYDALAWALYRSGLLEKASQAVAKALKLATPEPQFYLHAAIIAQALGENVAAERYLARGEQLNRFWPGVRAAQSAMR